MSDYQARLERYLLAKNEPPQIVQLTPDASTREYFRVAWRTGTAIACVYPEPFVAAEQSYLDVTRLFEQSGLPVPAIYDYDESLGVILQEDFGDAILREFLETSDDATRENYLHEAITLIARIQSATAKAFELGSIASRLSFDFEKLSWELDFFATHYFETFRRKPLETPRARALKAELEEVARELAGKASVLTHRDFHAANLMLGGDGRLRIIDHQDARIGSVAYDLVSLLLDRVTMLPAPEFLAEKRRFLLAERERFGLAPLDEADFAREFRLQTVQRCLKAIGTFSYQSAVRGKIQYIPYIQPMFEIVRRAAENLRRFPVLQEIIREQIDE